MGPCPRSGIVNLSEKKLRLFFISPVKFQNTVGMGCGRRTVSKGHGFESHMSHLQKVMGSNPKCPTYKIGGVMGPSSEARSPITPESPEGAS